MNKLMACRHEQQVCCHYCVCSRAGYVDVRVHINNAIRVFWPISVVSTLCFSLSDQSAVPDCTFGNVRVLHVFVYTV